VIIGQRALARAEEMSMPGAVRIRRLQTIGDREIQGLSERADRLRGSRRVVSFHAPDVPRQGGDVLARRGRRRRARERVVIFRRGRDGIESWAPSRSSWPSRRISRIVETSRRHARASTGGGGGASARPLLVAAERSALDAGKTLLVLDTASDDANDCTPARLQRWRADSELRPAARRAPPCATTYFFKSLRD